MEFFKLGAQSCSAANFVHFWSKRYDEGEYKDLDYEKNLNRQGLLTKGNIQFLLEWKRGNRLPKQWQSIANRLMQAIDIMNKFRQLPKVSNEEFSDFWSFISTIIESGIVLKVFVLHISRPEDYPIVDQHVLRAWNFLTQKKVEDPKKTLENYRKYRDSFLELTRKSGMNMRSVDRALMAFGQFLNTQFFPAIDRANF
jgi:hypothetical protein